MNDKIVMNSSQNFFFFFNFHDVTYFLLILLIRKIFAFVFSLGTLSLLFSENSKNLAKDNTQSAANESDPQSFNNQNAKFNFWIKFRRNNAAFMNQRPKRNKMVRFVEEKPDNSSHNVLKKPKRNCAKTIDEKLKKDDAVFFFKTLPDKPVTEPLSEPNKAEDTDADDGT